MENKQAHSITFNTENTPKKKVKYLCLARCLKAFLSAFFSAAHKASTLNRRWRGLKSTTARYAIKLLRTTCEPSEYVRIVVVS